MTTFEPTRQALLLRDADEADCQRLWEWRNEIGTRTASFNSREIPYDEHQHWYRSRLDDGRTRFFIAADPNGRDIGYARFDVAAPKAEISVAVDSFLRGRGYGTALIRAASNRVIAEAAVQSIRALVKLDNPASLAAFERAGYTRRRRIDVEDVEAWELLYEPEPERTIDRNVVALFRVDAGPVVGLGHLQRSLSLAAAFRERGATCRFLVNDGRETMDRVKQAGFDCSALSGVASWSAEDAAATVAAARDAQARLVAVDSDHDSAAYLSGLRCAGFYVCAIEDLANGPYPAHAVLNGDTNAEQLPYCSSRGDTVFLLGPRFAILGPEYWTVLASHPQVPPGRLLVTLGGGDARGILPALVRACHRLPPELKVTVVVGPFSRSLPDVETAVRSLTQDVSLVVAPTSLRSLIADADIAISAAGQTLYELACLGRPAVAIEVAANQHDQVAVFEAAGTVSLAGSVTDPDIAERALAMTVTLLASPRALAAMAEAGRKLIDGQGARRAADVLRKALRHADFSRSSQGTFT